MLKLDFYHTFYIGISQAFLGIFVLLLIDFRKPVAKWRKRWIITVVLVVGANLMGLLFLNFGDTYLRVGVITVTLPYILVTLWCSSYRDFRAAFSIVTGLFVGCIGTANEMLTAQLLQHSKYCEYYSFAVRALSFFLMFFILRRFSVTFQDCNVQLGEYAFLGCGKDAEVLFTNCTGTVDKYAFQYSDLASLSIDQCDLNIAKSAFASCEALTAITFQNSTLTAGEYAFFGVGDKAVVQADNCALTLDNWAFQYASLSELTITGDKAELGDAAFGSCEDLTAVTIDCPTVTLGEHAFSGCDDLTTIVICDNGQTENTITIEDYAFQYNDKLTSVTVGSGTVETGEYLFSGCPDDLSVSLAGKDYMTLA